MLKISRLPDILEPIPHRIFGNKPQPACSGFLKQMTSTLILKVSPEGGAKKQVCCLYPQEYGKENKHLKF